MIAGILIGGLLSGDLLVFAAPAGFAPSGQNLFTPLLQLGPPADPHAAIATIGQMVALYRLLILHPAMSERLAQVQDKLPARQSTLIRAAALYSDPAIPWHTDGDVHFIAVNGAPQGSEYLYDLAPRMTIPALFGHFCGRFSLQPQNEARDGISQSVIARLDGALYPGAFDPSQGLAVIAAALQEIYGDLSPPYDLAPGDFNAHDGAVLARIARDMPAVTAWSNHYLIINNLLDEFADNAGPYVLFNLDVELRDEALAPFPHLRGFYRALTRRVTGISITSDSQGRNWLRLQFKNGHFRITFMLRDGKLSPFDDRLRPAGDPIALAAVKSGRFTTVTSIWVTRLSMRFGISDLRAMTTFSHRDGAVELRTQLANVPRVLAPPVLHSLLTLIMQSFLDTLVHGNRGQGLVAEVHAVPLHGGGTMLSDSVSGQFRYSPPLEILARVGDAIADANNEPVRADERRFIGQFLAAVYQDYQRAQPALLASSTISTAAK